MVTVGRHAGLALALAAIAAGCAGPAQMTAIDIEPPLSRRPPLTVIYPRPTPADTLLAPDDSVIVMEKLTDSLFAFGSVNDPSAAVTVNNQPARVFDNGGWLAWVKSASIDTVDSLEGVTGRAIRAPVTIRRESTSNGGTVERQVSLIAPAEPSKPWELPRTAVDTMLVVTEENAKIRIGWPGTTNLYPSVGTRLHAIAASGLGDSLLWKLDLPGGEDLWIESGFVAVDSLAAPTEIQVVHKAVASVDGRWTRIRVPLEAKVPFRVHRVDDDRLELTLYNAVSWTDIIIQPSGSKVVDEVRWSQPDSGRFRLTAFLHPAWFWGWETVWEGDTTLVWSIREAPELSSNPFTGLTVVVDPGHGGENISAIGPTGLWESRANLPLAISIARQLRKAGATVYLTRTADVSVDLLERIQFARDHNADLLISVHHNGLPQGKNPWLHHGPSIHYAHRNSKPLAAEVYNALTADGRSGDGVRYQDLALARPTWLPAILIEAAYLLHPEEEQEIRTEKYRREIAKRVRRGVKLYLEKMRQLQHENDEYPFAP